MNNFDQSSTGINLSLNIFKDIHRSKMEFEESFHVYQYGGNRKKPILIWTQHGNHSFDNNFFDDEAHKIPEGMTESDLLETLKDWVNEDVYVEIVEEFFDLKETLTFDAVLDAARREIDGFIDWKDEVLEEQYTEIGVTGYCQGDYTEVIVPHKTLEGTPYHPEYEGEDKRFVTDLERDFENIIFNAPITGKLEVSIPKHTGFETEIDLHDGIEDQYKYDKDEIVKVVSSDPHIQKLPNEDREYILFWVNDNLPDDPEYIH